VRAGRRDNVDVQMLGNVEYVNGSGPFFGFLNLQYPSQSLLGLRMDGQAKRHRDGTTDLNAKLRVVGGIAALSGAKGTGTITGERREELGGAIDIEITVRLRGVSSSP